MSEKSRPTSRRWVTAATTLVVVSIGLCATRAAAQTTYAEPASGGFGSPTLPPEAQEFYISSFGGTTYYYDIHGRVVANADVTRTATNPGSLTQIQPRLWSNTDADLFKIRIIDPALFTAQITSATNILALFHEDGTAIAASRGGGAANAITGATLGITPGQYLIGESQASGAFGSSTFGVPRNDAGLPLFDFTTDGVKLPAVQADMRLSTDPFEAWTINNGMFLIGPSTFTSPGSAINLTGADFSVIPEPCSAILASFWGAAYVSRRRRRQA